MGKEVMNSDDVIGNAFVDGLGIACSYDQEDAPILEDALVPGASLALSNLTEAIRKYGNGETIDVPRVSKLAKAAGTCLACTTATPKLGTVVSKDLGDARLKAVDAIFLLLGSTAFRKDEEVALWAGEALAAYSDAYSPKDVEWSTSKSVWPEENNEEFALALPPHQQVGFTDLGFTLSELSCTNSMAIVILSRLFISFCGERPSRAAHIRRLQLHQLCLLLLHELRNR